MIVPHDIQSTNALIESQSIIKLSLEYNDASTQLLFRALFLLSFALVTFLIVLPPP